ncbi:uncharacterized protein DDB_G0288739-like isoform X3 [Actinia tenebrosa]|uniref:Uncharacterized protein DDB_G0288739-like isoform X3 n=1 Tax=Actinia tenebrosa TaxID=6105 RepID=A0A6P8HBW5_ACTTE|nr:uncharacterized protein DDB_G0288739-like isoform X3 [Actinia tenebrosa]
MDFIKLLTLLTFLLFTLFLGAVQVHENRIKIFIPLVEGRGVHSWKQANYRCSNINASLAVFLSSREAKSAVTTIKNIKKNILIAIGLKRNGKGSITWMKGQNLDNEVIRTLGWKNTLEAQISGGNCFYMNKTGSLFSTICIYTEKELTPLCETYIRPNTNAPFSVSTNIGNNGNNGNNGNGNNGNSGNKGNGKGNKQVESFVNGMKDLKPHNKDSLKNAMNLTTTLMKNIERGTKNGNEKSNFMKGALQLEKFSIEYAKQHINKTNKDPIRRNNERFVLEMRKVFTKPQKNLKFPEDLNRGEATIIELPASLFNVIKDSGIVMVSSLFTGVSDTLPTLTEDSSKKHLLISDVISSTLDPKPEGVLPENVTIILEHTNMSQPSSYKPKCVFWKFKVDNQFNGTWSSSGCTVKESNNNRTVCSCNHMTSFALLMQVDEQKTVSCMLLF